MGILNVYLPAQLKSACSMTCTQLAAGDTGAELWWNEEMAQPSAPCGDWHALAGRYHQQLSTASDVAGALTAVGFELTPLRTGA